MKGLSNPRLFLVVRQVVLLAVWLLLALVASSSTAQAQGKIFVVDSEDSGRPDNDPGDGICDTRINPDNPDTPTPVCTFQGAADETNALPGHHTITFASSVREVEHGVRFKGTTGPSGITIDGGSGAPVAIKIGILGGSLRFQGLETFTIRNV